MSSLTNLFFLLKLLNWTLDVYRPEGLNTFIFKIREKSEKKNLHLVQQIVYSFDFILKTPNSSHTRKFFCFVFKVAL